MRTSLTCAPRTTANHSTTSIPSVSLAEMNITGEDVEAGRLMGLDIIEMG